MRCLCLLLGSNSVNGDYCCPLGARRMRCSQTKGPLQVRRALPSSDLCMLTARPHDVASLPFTGQLHVRKLLRRPHSQWTASNSAACAICRCCWYWLQSFADHAEAQAPGAEEASSLALQLFACQLVVC